MNRESPVSNAQFNVGRFYTFSPSIYQPLKHAKKPTSPRVQKKRNGQQSQDSVQHSQDTLEDIAKIEPNKHEVRIS
jgi:hypothetical protein